MEVDQIMNELTDEDLWEGLTVAERKAIPLEDFAWPEERKYPCDTQDHVDACARLLGHAPENMQAKIRARAIKIAKRHGFALPDTWKEEEGKESAHWDAIKEHSHLNLLAEQLVGRPQKKIGTLPICWLEYNARSLNGRIYPKSTCDAIFRAAQEVLNNPNAMPPTTFVSHEAANGNVNTALIGAPVKVWQEGSKFWAHIDIADTSVARDILGLLEGKYLRSGSMRVAGVELMHDRNYDLPLVVVQEGVTPQFLGIDLTTRPGLADIARTSQVLYESGGQESYYDAFTFECLSIQEESPSVMPIPIFIQIALGTLTEATPSREAHMRVHDHLAGVMDEAMGKACHGSESARYRALIEGQLDEAGRAIAQKHAQRLAAAHDESARQLGMKCEGCYGDMAGMAPSDTDNDGDDPAAGYDPDNDGESSRQRGKTLTEAELLAALRAKGYTIEAPKTEAEKKLAALEAQVAEQNKKIAQLTEAQPTQRQTLATPPQFEEGSTLQPEDLYQEGDLMKGELRAQNWAALSDRRVPWPHDKIDPKQALHEMAPFLAQRLLAQEANAFGRSIDQFVGPNEEI